MIEEIKDIQQEAERRARSKAVQAELEVMDQERKAAELRNAEALAERRRMQAAADNIAVKDLSDLKPLYQERQEAFNKLEAAVRDFLRIEMELLPKLTEAVNRSGIQFMRPEERRNHAGRLREMAGLTFYHDDLQAPKDRQGNIAWTISMALLRGMIQPCYLWTGTERIPLNRPG